MPTLLFECFSEEVPARLQRGGREQLAALVTKALETARVEHGNVITYASPRHLALRIEGLPEVQPDVTIEKKGPKLGAPQAAIDGFLASSGLTLEQCEQRVVGKDTVLFASVTHRGRPMATLIQEILETALRDFVWPKSMRWGARDMQWVRPLHALTCLLGSAVIPVRFGHLTASNVTYGHRFLSPTPITLAHADEYVGALEKAHVIVDQEARRERILAQAKDAAQKSGLTLVEDAGLLEEVTGLVEWPVCYVGSFDTGFMRLPREVLTSEMRHHQKYFALQDAQGELSPHFMITANMPTNDGGKAIAEGNARVLRARLSDGAFFWEQDAKTKLDDWNAKLADVVFHARVGMMSEKVERIVALADTLASSLDSRLSTLDSSAVKRAAQLCKADLTTGMVGEFPELQGIMGRYYALAQGESAEVADAIRDHYKPVGAGDDIPTHPVAICVALADKLDSITSLFAAGEKPTGSKDPLALRRAALGCLRILLDNNLDIALNKVSAQWNQELFRFFNDRLSALLKEGGISYDIIDAVMSEIEVQAAAAQLTSSYSYEYNPARIRKLALAIRNWKSLATSGLTLASYKRAANILSAEEKKAKTTYRADALKPELLTEAAEKALYEALTTTHAAMQPLLETEDFAGALAKIADLSAPLSTFFDTILVNAEDAGLRTNRLSLLALIRDTMHQIADFSLIEG